MLKLRKMMLFMEWVVMCQGVVWAAPPTDYEGFGAVTRGALDAPGGYEVYHVTSLADTIYTPGTLRYALENHGAGLGAVYIVFDVGGTINRTENYLIKRSYLTIDGSTAPYPGITIDTRLKDANGTVYSSFDFSIESRSTVGPVHDIIINNLRFIGPGVAFSKDILAIDGTAEPVSNIIIDHVSIDAAGDGIFDMRGEISNVTLSWNLITGTVVGTAFTGDVFERTRISMHHNVYAHNNERQPKIKSKTTMVDLVNNVCYGWSWHEGGGKGLQLEPPDNPSLADPNIYPSANIIGNYYYYVNGVGVDYWGLKRTNGLNELCIGLIYFEDNIFPDVENEDYNTSTKLVIPSYAEVTKYNASTLGDTVVPFVGTHYPTQEEQNLLDEISTTISPNQPPIADAGLDQTITDKDKDGSEQVTLDGSVSRDPDGTIVSFIWSEGGLEIATGKNPTVTLSTGTHSITLTVADDGGSTDNDTVTIKVLEGDKGFGELPAGCYNNVFNPTKGEKALIVVELPKQARVMVNLYNTRGSKIRELADEEKEAGTHKYYWDGKSGNGDDVGSGLYFVHIQAGDYKKTKKIVVVK